MGDAIPHTSQRPSQSHCKDNNQPSTFIHQQEVQPPYESPPDRVLQCGRQYGPQILSHSSNFSTGAWTVNNIGGDMVIHDVDYERIQRVIAVEIQRIQRGLPAVVGHSMSNAMIITDALGETLTLPRSIVPAYEDLQRLLVNHFKGKLGEQRVSKGRYCIGRAEGIDDELVVKASDWETIKNEGRALVMSMVIEQVPAKRFREMCPKCGKTELGTYVDGGWRVCRRCYTRFILPGKPVIRRKSDIAHEDREEVSGFRHVRKKEVKVVLQKVLGSPKVVELQTSAESARRSPVPPRTLEETIKIFFQKLQLV
ncbi:hypothetical protein DFP72DRAFT_211995 [Ephemerocybe angulata]|uniref:Ubiquitin-like domain-containing protein n=1 Tax=Ephemerocybe angulata TaxID=980116 RepID=A0A8H6M9P6_9AGAR|nr:hypothetical protein DFP72DRAFT_211995 [Tulosesus angulatus]